MDSRVCVCCDYVGNENIISLYLSPQSFFFLDHENKGGDEVPFYHI